MRLSYCTCSVVSRKEGLAPIILLHTLGFCKFTWKNVQERLSRRTGRVVYAVDFRDHGGSSWSDHFCDVKCADDIEEFMDERGIRKAILIGHQFGTTVAMHVALRRPDRIEIIFLSEPNLYAPGTSPRKFNQMIVDTVRRSVSAIPVNVDDKDIAAKLFLFYFLAFDEAKVMFSENQKPKDTKILVHIKKGKDGKWEPTFNLDVIEKFNVTPCTCKEDRGCKVYLGPTAVLTDKKLLSLRPDQQMILKNHFPKTTLLQTAEYIGIIHFKYPEDFVNIVVGFIDDKSNKDRKRPRSKY